MEVKIKTFVDIVKVVDKESLTNKVKRKRWVLSYKRLHCTESWKDPLSIKKS